MGLDLGTVELEFGFVAVGFYGKEPCALHVCLYQQPDGKAIGFHDHEQTPYGLLILVYFWQNTRYADVENAWFRSVEMDHREAISHGNGCQKKSYGHKDSFPVAEQERDCQFPVQKI